LFLIVDPKQTFRFPRSLMLLRSPNLRIIAEDVWASSPLDLLLAAG
jgi:hypothetical protein